MKFPRLLAFLSALALTACGSSATRVPSQPTSDSGTSPDTGRHTADSGHDSAPSSPDAGASKDSGGHDSHEAVPDSSGTPEASPPADAGTDGIVLHPADAAFTPGTPITATAGEWTWVPFDGAVCANGSSTGIGVNLSSTADARVLLYLEGGGACWSDLTCYTLMTASYITSGYGQSEFTAESTDATYLALPGGFFDRTAAANPFKDYNYVYVPYCTGDVHAGDNVVQYSATTHFAGWTNFGQYLDRLVPTFSGTDRVILAGSSAGGFGAAFNWERTQNAFGSIRVDLLDDSGTAMPADIEAHGIPDSTFATPWKPRRNPSARVHGMHDEPRCPLWLLRHQVCDPPWHAPQLHPGQRPPDLLQHHHGPVHLRSR